VQSKAWETVAALEPTSANRVGALNTILSAEQLAAKLDGTIGPDATMSQTTINMLRAPEWVATRSALLAALRPYPDARIAVAVALTCLEEPPDEGHTTVDAGR
jgi:hypothetical protein